MTRSQTHNQATERVAEVVALLDRYATADRELTETVERIRLASAADGWICPATAQRLTRLLHDSLAPGLRAKNQLDRLPPPLRCAGIASWARQLLHRGEGWS